MGNAADLVGEVAAFCAAWVLLALVIGLGYGWVCRWGDRRAFRDREIRALLTDIGRLAQEDRRLAMIANVEELVSDVRFARAFSAGRSDVDAAIAADEAERDARAVAKLRRDLGPSRRPPLVAVPDPVIREAV